MDAEKITVGIVNYNGIHYLPKTLESVQGLDYPLYEIIVVDNFSTDGSRKWLNQHYPHLRCILLDNNFGSAYARNIILNEAQTDYVLMLDNDIEVKSGTLSRLMCVIKEVPGAAVCHPEICDENDPFAFHYNGGWTHYLGAHISRPDPKNLKSRPAYEPFSAVSGAAMLINRPTALKIGGFDPDYFFNWEDGDFTARLTLSGHKCLNIPDVTVNHHHKYRGTSKFFYQVRNRWFFMLKLYSWQTLVLSIPMLIFFELLQVLFCIAKGAAKDYLRGNLAVIRSLSKLHKKRKEFHKSKMIRDKDWLISGEMYIPDADLKPAKRFFIHILYRLFNLYWKIIRPLC